MDFLVIGAAKSGTTTLFELARGHPGLLMPRDKELPYFSEDAIYHKGLEWYMRTYFPARPANRLLGTMTPHYMLGEGSTNPEIIAERIKQALPRVKLVALLRHPVHRAFSHYRMMVQRSHITVDFPHAVTTLLDMEDLDRFRCMEIDDSNGFLFGSEYGRILENYYERFGAKNILVLYTEDLKARPDLVLQRLFAHLGVDDEYRPPRLDQEFRKGGGEPKFKLLTPGYIYRIPLLKTFWKTRVPYPLRKRVEYSMNLWNTRSDRTALAPDDPTYQRLVAHYAPDVKRLEQLVGHKTPWPDWDR